MLHEWQTMVKFDQFSSLENESVASFPCTYKCTSTLRQ